MIWREAFIVFMIVCKARAPQAGEYVRWRWVREMKVSTWDEGDARARDCARSHLHSVYNTGWHRRPHHSSWGSGSCTSPCRPETQTQELIDMSRLQVPGEERLWRRAFNAVKKKTQKTQLVLASFSVVPYFHTSARKFLPVVSWYTSLSFIHFYCGNCYRSTGPTWLMFLPQSSNHALSN